MYNYPHPTALSTVYLSTPLPTMDHIKSLKCLICGKEYAPGEIEYVCPDHGYEGIVDVQYDYELIGRQISPETLRANRDMTIWRYKPLLPIEPESPVPPLAVGWTPLYEAPRLAESLGLKHLWVKDDGRQATASFKDRASAIAVVKTREKGAAIVTTASTGNAAAALSGLCASVQQPNVIFVPETAPPAKIAQLLTFGSTVMLVHGTYDDAFELCLQAAETYGWYNRNTGFNPYMSEGKKTVSFEICETTPAPPPRRRGKADGSAGRDLRQRRRRLHHRRRAQGLEGSAGAGLDRHHAAHLWRPGCGQQLHGRGMAGWAVRPATC